jgi:hypothetical protein
MSDVHRSRDELSASQDSAARAAKAFSASLGPDHRDKKLADAQATDIQMTPTAR